jgi:hypothetical protein
LTPQAPQTWLVGSNRPMRAKYRPWQAAFSSIIRQYIEQQQRPD